MSVNPIFDISGNVVGKKKNNTDMFNNSLLDSLPNKIKKIAIDDINDAKNNIYKAITELNNVQGVKKYLGEIIVQRYDDVFMHIFRRITDLADEVAEQEKRIIVEEEKKKNNEIVIETKEILLPKEQNAIDDETNKEDEKELIIPVEKPIEDDMQPKEPIDELDKNIIKKPSHENLMSLLESFLSQEETEITEKETNIKETDLMSIDFINQLDELDSQITKNNVSNEKEDMDVDNTVSTFDVDKWFEIEDSFSLEEPKE